MKVFLLTLFAALVLGACAAAQPSAPAGTPVVYVVCMSEAEATTVASALEEAMPLRGDPRFPSCRNNEPFIPTDIDRFPVVSVHADWTGAPFTLHRVPQDGTTATFWMLVWWEDRPNPYAPKA